MGSFTDPKEAPIAVVVSQSNPQTAAVNNTPTAVPTVAAVTSPVAAQEAPPAQVGEIRAAKHNSHPEIVHSSSSGAVKAWDDKDEDLGVLMDELYPVPDFSVIANAPMKPDGSLSADDANERLEGLQDQAKYALWMGHDKLRIKSVKARPRELDLMIDDPNGPYYYVNLIWKDVSLFHTSEIRVYSHDGSKLTGLEPAQMIYQLGVLAPPLKKPVLFQCNSGEDLKDLVTAMEYWVKRESEGEYADILGLPYLYQGLVPGEKGAITALWAGSPVYKAGLKLGDVLWSVGHLSGERGRPNDLTQALDDLSPGKRDLFVQPGGDENAPRKKLELKVP